MAKWCVIVLLLAQNVFANEDLSLCDMCIRKGATWCLDKNKLGCIEIASDTSCPHGQTVKLVDITKNINGHLLKPIHAERTLYITDLKQHLTDIKYTSAVERKVTTSLIPQIDITVGNTICNGTECTVEIYAWPARDFCSFFDHVDIRIRVENFTEEATIRYHMHCSCPCTSQMEPNSDKCKNHGNFTCGICSCESEWTGENCDNNCYRGDGNQPNDMCLSDNGETLECYGNGDCVCNFCKCFDDVPGAQYFRPEDKCVDVCTQTIECSACLLNGTLGECNQCEWDFTMVELNKTALATETDESHRKTWVHCKEQVDECDFDYYAMRIKDHFYAMMNTNCNAYSQDVLVSGPASTKVPLIVGIIGIIAAIATIGGILLWKHMNTLPALAMTDPQYANIDPEDTTGVNPIYKPPTSSFKNPTYGKW